MFALKLALFLFTFFTAVLFFFGLPFHLACFFSLLITAGIVLLISLCMAAAYPQEEGRR
jgi:hypothetical protein